MIQILGKYLFYIFSIYGVTSHFLARYSLHRECLEKYSLGKGCLEKHSLVKYKSLFGYWYLISKS
ncbi:hypothetical protein P5E92_01660 [Clostridium perfringens]|nr:hypothetical protein [Clostridium perfringens]